MPARSRGRPPRRGRPGGALAPILAALLLLAGALPLGSSASPRSPTRAPGRAGEIPPTIAEPSRTAEPRSSKAPVGPLPIGRSGGPEVPRLGLLPGVPAGARPPRGSAPYDGPEAPHGLPILRPSPSARPPNLTLSGGEAEEIDASQSIGNLTLEGNALLVVQGGVGPTTLLVNGNIAMSGNATLFVNHSTLAINESYDVEWSLVMTNRSVFAVAYGNVTSNGYQWGGEFEGDANVTAFEALVEYPVGWLDATFLQNASLYLVLSFFLADVILYDAPAAASTSRFHAIDSLGFNVWLDFKPGTSASIALPPGEGYLNWTFPGPYPVSGVNYSIALSDCYVAVFAVLLWQGANLSIANSSAIAVGLDLEEGVTNLTGLSEGAIPALRLTSDGLDLSLSNDSVRTWNVYPFGGAVDVYDSKVGEIQVYDGAAASVDDSNLSGDGGYYGAQGSGASLAIDGSSIAAELDTIGGSTSLTDCRFDPPVASRVLAVDGGFVLSTSTTLGPLDRYEAEGDSEIDVAELLTARVVPSEPGGSVPPAVEITVRSTPAGPVVAQGTASGSPPSWGTYVRTEQIEANGTTDASYGVDASAGIQGAEVEVVGAGSPISVNLSLEPLIAGTTPENGTTGVPLDVVPTISFTAPMDPAAGGLEPLVAPFVATSDVWSLDNTTLEIKPSKEWRAGTPYTITLEPGGQTASGIDLVGAFQFTFGTATPPVLAVPSVVATDPAPGARNVSRTAEVSVDFSVPMAPTTLVSAFSIAPGAPGTIRTAGNNTTLFWTPTEALAANTTYTVTIGITAESVGAVPLAEPYAFAFTTAPVPPVHHNVTGPPPSSGVPPADYAVAGAFALLAIAAVLAYRRRRDDAPPSEPP